MLVAIGTTAYVAPKVFAIDDFTVSNVTFDPTTGLLEYDFTGTDTNVGAIVDSTDLINKQYWAVINNQSCISGHCIANMAPIRSDAGVTSVRIRDGGTRYSQTINYPLPLPTTNTSQHSIAGGWTNVGETWTYASADSPTFTATASGDLTGVYTPGQRIKLTQSSTTKYFLVTGVSYSSPNTTITLYGGTDYTLANSAISNIYFSSQKAPVGFPLDQNKWTVKTDSSSSTNQGSPTANTWYNVGGVSLSVPIGSWKISYATNYGWDASTVGGYNAAVTLSTSNNSQDDVDMTSVAGFFNSTIATSDAYREKYVNLTSKTTYYLNISTTVSGLNFLYMGGGSSGPAIIRATSAYL